MAGSYSERSSVETSRLGHFSDELTEVLAARSASKNFHFSRSLVIVGCGWAGPLFRTCTPRHLGAEQSARRGGGHVPPASQHNLHGAASPPPGLVLGRLCGPADPAAAAWSGTVFLCLCTIQCKIAGDHSKPPRGAAAQDILLSGSRCTRQGGGSCSGCGHTLTCLSFLLQARLCVLPAVDMAAVLEPS